MHFHIITLFPNSFDSYLGESILNRAIEDKKLKVSFYNSRDYAEDKWARVDRPPYAGGPGMVIQAEPVIRAITKAIAPVAPAASLTSIALVAPTALPAIPNPNPAPSGFLCNLNQRIKWSPNA